MRVSNIDNKDGRNEGSYSLYMCVQSTCILDAVCIYVCIVPNTCVESFEITGCK